MKGLSSVGFIGGGLMATAIIKGLLKQGYEAERFMVSDPDFTRREILGKLGIKTFQDNSEMLIALESKEVEGVILAVKPQVVKEALTDVKIPELPLLSIVAGFPVSSLETLLPEAKVLRAMPNTPALIGEGITAITAGTRSGEPEIKWAKEILSSLGAVVTIPESLMDAVTGLSGSGPGFVYFFIEALIDGGVLAGLPRQLSRELALQTVLGSTQMVSKLQEHPAVLRDMVTSPGGTTITGLTELELGGVHGQLMKAVLAATEKSKELGE